MKRVEILGVKTDDLSLDEAVNLVNSWLIRKGKHFIVTPNPEFLVAAHKDASFKKVLNSADLSIPDGVGLKLSGRVRNRISGIDLMERLISEASKKAYTVGFIGGRKNVAKKAAINIQKKFPKLKISFAESGGEVDRNGNMINDYRLKINEKDKKKNPKSLIINHQSLLRLPKADLLFVAFGAKKQEKWIARNMSAIPVKVAMGVGGAFDYLSGDIKRSPKILRDLGLEWLFRLLTEPWRIKRQLALIEYLYLLLLDSIRRK